MADIYFDVDTALAEVPVNVLPLIDSATGASIQGAVAYNAAGLALRWHFVTSAGAYTVTSVTPTNTGGAYDWTDQGDSGIYTIEIPATDPGSGTIWNDTEGYGWFTGVATGILPWRSPIYGFRAAAINDSLCDTNTTGLLAPTTAGRTLDVSAGGEAGIDWANVGSPTTAVNLSATNIDVDQVVASVSGAVGSVTGHTAQTGDVYALANGATGFAAIDTVVDAIKVKTYYLPSATAGSAGGVFIAGSNAATSITTALTANITGNVSGSVGSVTGAVGSVTGSVGSVTGAVGSVTGLTASDVGAIKTKTDSLTFTVAGELDANIQSVNGVALIGDGSTTPWGPA